MKKHVTCIRRYTGVQTSSGDTASTDGLIEDDPLAEEIGGEETRTVHIEIPVHNQEPQAKIVDRQEVGTSQAAPLPLQSRKRNKATTGANKAQNVTLGRRTGLWTRPQPGWKGQLGGPVGVKVKINKELRRPTQQKYPGPMQIGMIRSGLTLKPPWSRS